MTPIWYIWIFQITLRWKAFILFFLPAKGTAMQWPYNCWVWMVGLGPVIGVLSWWRGPTCPFCICATCESGSCRYVDGMACWFQVSGMFCCLSRWLSCYSSSNAFLYFVLLIFPQNLAFLGVVCFFFGSGVDLPTSRAPFSFTLLCGASKGSWPDLSLFQRTCLGILNYFRSVERTLTINTSGLTLVAGSLVPTIEDNSCVNMAKGGLGTLQGLGAHHYVHGTAAEHKVSLRFCWEFFLPQLSCLPSHLLLSPWNLLTWWSNRWGFLRIQLFRKVQCPLGSRT